MKPTTVLAFLVIATVQADARQGMSTPETDYRVGPQDILMITVFDERELTGRYTVDDDGTFTFPLVGRVTAGGFSLRTIQERLTAKLADGYLNNPQIRVEVEQYRSQSVFVIGEVRNPGKYSLTGKMTLIEALAQAGSTTATASPEVLVIHPGNDAAAAGPALPDDHPDADTVRVNIADLQSGKLTQNVALRDGDTIFVPKADTFFVTGHVKVPGSYVVQPGMTILQAISLAGGISDRGSNRRLKVIRVVGSHKKEISVELTDPVQPGDTIVVSRRFF